MSRKQLLLMFAAIVPAWVCADPPYAGTAFLHPDILTARDRTTFIEIVDQGRGDRLMFDRRADWVTLNAFLFEATFHDGLTIEVQVNPEFQTVVAAREVAEKYAREVGRMPTALRASVDTMWIHRGEEAFGGGNRNILVHTDQSVTYEALNSLHEVLLHEGAHTSLDGDHASAAGWLAAQRGDPEFISEYARDFPTREDVAESIVPYLAVRLRSDRIPNEMRQTIEATMPSRMAYLDGVGMDLYPMNVAVRAVTGDLTGNESSNVLLRSESNGRWVRFDLLDGGAVSNAPLSLYTSENWTFQGGGDFDGDGDVDVLMRHTSGTWRIFEIQGGAVTGSAVARLFTNNQWQFAAAGDLDQDGDADIVLRHRDSGAWRVFEISNRNVVSNHTLQMFTNERWFLQGVADFDGDGDSDLLLRSADGSVWYRFEVEDLQVLGARPMPELFTDADWQYVAAADLDTDGASDVVLRHTGTGEWRVFQIVNGAVNGSAKLSMYRGLAWSVASIGDFDGDGDHDFLLRKAGDGAWRLFVLQHRKVSRSEPIRMWRSPQFQPRPIW